ncbi:WD40 repeat domain-containing protein [Kitasatospora sp. NPDC004723]|uniref:WD40 repeat domain-containing protein n=1 Tax=Kitasatospora sp. NPDC004723 TaxID=3154288 RepID=UPI0033ADC6CD
MSGEPAGGVPAAEHTTGQAQVTDHRFLVAADPGEVATGLATARGPTARLAAAVYRASAQAHGTADAATRRQILALDAARFGDRALSDGLAAVALPQAPDARWRVDWATGSGVHPRFLGLLGATDAAGPPLVDVDGRPAVLVRDRDGALLLRDPVTGDPVLRPSAAGSVPGQECSALLDGRPVTVRCDGNGVPTLLDPATGEPLGTLATDENEPGPAPSTVAALTFDGRPHVLGDDGAGFALWDLTTSGLAGRIVVLEDDDLRTWAVLELDGRPHVVVGGFRGTIGIWDLQAGARVAEECSEDVDLRQPVAAAVGGRPHLLTVGSDPCGGEPLEEAELWSLDPLRRVDRLPVGRGGLTTAVANGRCWVVGEGGRAFELSDTPPVGSRTLGHRAVVRAIASTVLDGRPVVVSGDDEVLRLWDLATGEPLGPPLSTAPHADAHESATERVRDLASGAEAAAEAAAETARQAGEEAVLAPEVAALAPEGLTAAATGTVDGRPVALFAVRHRVRVWDLSGEPVVSDELAFPEPVAALAVTADGRVLAGFGHDLAVLSPH